MRPTKTQLEQYIAAKPRARKVPGYFDGDGNLQRGPFYMAQLGKQCVGVPEASGYIDGYYVSRAEALDAARLFQSNARRILESGDYAKD